MSEKKKEVGLTPEEQVGRLTSQVFANPYEVLMLGPEATDE